VALPRFRTCSLRWLPLVWRVCDAVRVNYQQQPHFRYVQGSQNTARNLLVGVTCFSVSPEMGDGKQTAVTACSDRECTGCHTGSLFHLTKQVFPILSKQLWIFPLFVSLVLCARKVRNGFIFRKISFCLWLS